MLTETQESNLEDVLNQVAFTGAYTPATEAVENIEQVTKDNIVQVCDYPICAFTRSKLTIETPERYVEFVQS